MFDKLIESNSVQADFKPRRKFFMVSSVVVGIMFLSAVVISLYAQDLDLGTNTFEIVEMIAPVPTDVPEPEPPRQEQQRSSTQEAQLPSRQMLIARLDRPDLVPNEISSVPSKYETMPEGHFKLDPNGPDRGGYGGPGGVTTGSPISGSGSEAIASDPVTEVPPPAAAKPVESKRPTMKTEGVINGKATYLPQPAFPTPAKQVGAYGIVNVQVTIDENGKVISSKAVSGHPLLRGTAESAAWKARFTTTYLSRVPVKVTGVIVFNFKKS